VIDKTPPAPGWTETLYRVGSILLLVVVIAWALRGSEFQLDKPDMTVAKTVFVSTTETIQIALSGTFLSICISFFLGLMAAENLSPRWISQPTKWFLAFLRGIPIILLALMFVSTVGLGPLPGVLAIAFHSTGMLGKFYAESFENAREGPIEALDSAGANIWQKVRFGVLTQVGPDLARDTLFRFELNLRESLVLGLVGAGGIGFYILLYIRAFQYEKVATLTIVVLLMVLMVEQISVAIRRRLR
jgi:phosphonate transport system permease protein